MYYVAIVTVFGALLGALERRLDLVRRQPDALAGPALEGLRHGLGSAPLVPRSPHAKAPSAPMKGANANTEPVRAAPKARWASRYKRKLSP